MVMLPTDKRDEKIEALEAENARLTSRLERAEKVVELYAKFYEAFERADGNRGCFSCSNTHDCRCDVDRGISDICTCGRVELDAAEKELRAALDAHEKGDTPR